MYLAPTRFLSMRLLATTEQIYYDVLIKVGMQGLASLQIQIAPYMSYS